jgi:hypothetical protein
VADEAILTWTFANWVSVTLMALISFGALGFAMKVWQARQQKKGAGA